MNRIPMRVGVGRLASGPHTQFIAAGDRLTVDIFPLVAFRPRG